MDKVFKGGGRKFKYIRIYIETFQEVAQHALKARTSRYRTCKTHILTLLVESYGFFTNQLIVSKLSKNVHYSKKEVWLSDILTYTYQFSKKYLEN